MLETSLKITILLDKASKLSFSRRDLTKLNLMKTEHLSSDQQKCEALSLPRTVSYGLLGAIWSIVRQTCPVKRAVIGYRREGLQFEEKSCADPGFCQRGPTLYFLFLEGREDPNKYH